MNSEKMKEADVDKKVFSMGMKTLSDAYINFRLEPNQLNTWFERLKDLDDIFFVGRVKKFIETSRYPPTIADLREGSEPQGITAAEAWGIARGYARNGKISDNADPKIVRTINYVGWYRMQYTDYDQLGFLEREFCRAFNEFSEIEKYQELSLPSSERSDRKMLSASQVKGLGDGEILGGENETNQI